MANQDALAGIVRRDPASLEGAARVLTAVHEFDGYPAWWPSDPLNWLTPVGMRRAWVAQLHGAVIGHICVVGDVIEPTVATAAGVSTDELLTVSRLFTHPAARGQHLGARLLAVAQEYADARGHQLMLDVLDDDGTAIHLYDRLRWKRVDRRQSNWVTPDGQRFDTVSFLAPRPNAVDRDEDP